MRFTNLLSSLRYATLLIPAFGLLTCLQVGCAGEEGQPDDLGSSTSRQTKHSSSSGGTSGYGGSSSGSSGYGDDDDDCYGGYGTSGYGGSSSGGWGYGGSSSGGYGYGR